MLNIKEVIAVIMDFLVIELTKHSVFIPTFAW